MGKRFFLLLMLVLVMGAGCGGGGGGGGSGPDATPPIITGGPSATGIDHESATITWTTNESSTSIVKFGKTASYSDSVVSTAYVTGHSVDINGLDAVTLYHYKVFSADEAGNRVGSSSRTFTTGSPVGKFVGEGWDFFEAADLDSSLARFQAAAALDPDDIEALEGLVWTYLYMYEFDDCETALGQALAVDPDRLDCLVAAAFLYGATEAFEEAISAAEHALAGAGPHYAFAYDSDVTDRDVRYTLILALAGTGDFEGALDEARVLDLSVDIDPLDPGTWGGHSTFEEAMIALIDDLRDRV